MTESYLRRQTLCPRYALLVNLDLLVGVRTYDLRRTVLQRYGPGQLGRRDEQSRPRRDHAVRPGWAGPLVGGGGGESSTCRASLLGRWLGREGNLTLRLPSGVWVGIQLEGRVSGCARTRTENLAIR